MAWNTPRNSPGAPGGVQLVRSVGLLIYLSLFSARISRLLLILLPHKFHNLGTEFISGKGNWGTSQKQRGHCQLYCSRKHCFHQTHSFIWDTQLEHISDLHCRKFYPAVYEGKVMNATSRFEMSGHDTSSIQSTGWILAGIHILKLELPSSWIPEQLLGSQLETSIRIALLYVREINDSCVEQLIWGVCCHKS